MNDKDEKNPKRWVACPIEDEYFSDSLKQSRKERKRLSAKDRSKYKKTDIKEKERISTKDLCRGRVLSVTSRGMVVEHEGRNITCSLRGNLKKERNLSKNLVTVGDFVFYEKVSEDEGIISEVEPRKSILSRADNLSRRKEQLIAANIDQVLITASVVSPPLKTSLIDRYIIAARKGNMTPIIVINKIDLLKDSPDEADLFQELLSAYKEAEIPVYPVSTVTQEGMDALRGAMQGKASVFSGQSGTGKSSLINAIGGHDFLVGETVKRTKKGAHTTSTAQLVPLSFGGWCIDTPGIKSFGVWDLAPDEVRHYFNEIQEHSKDCKYPDCTHTHETGCVVRGEVEKGNISPIRYDSYLSLMETIQEQHRRR